MILKKVKVKDLGKVITGTTPPTKIKEYYADEYNFIKPSYIEKNVRFFNESEEKLSELAKEKYINTFVPELSTCVVTIGSIGEKICLTKELCLTNQQINTVIPNEKYDNMFVYYLLKYNLFKVKAANAGSSSGRENVNKSTFENIEVEVPNIQIQKKIVKILSAYDNLIENNLKRIKLLEESAELLYKEWFINFRYPGCESQIGSSGIPKDWNNIEVKQFGDVITGKTPSTKKGEYYGGDVKFIKTPDMNDSIYVIKTNQTLTEEGAKSQEKKFVPKNSILVSCIGTVGVVSLTSELSQFNQQINALVPFEEEYVYYLYFKFKSLKETLEALGSSGATMANVNKGKFESIKILNPDKKVIKLFYDQCEVVFRQILNLQYTNEKLVEARDILIPKLMTGEIEV